MPKKEKDTQPLADQLEAQKAREKTAQVAASKIDVQADDQRGVGGAYVFDPLTKTRKRVAGPRVTLPTGEISDPAVETATAQATQATQATQTTETPNTEIGGTQ